MHNLQRFSIFRTTQDLMANTLVLLTGTTDDYLLTTMLPPLQQYQSVDYNCHADVCDILRDKSDGRTDRCNSIMRSSENSNKNLISLYECSSTGIIT
jgi:hypothetical protein